MPPSTPSHPTKRQNRTITTFFPINTTTAHPPAPTDTLSPALPPTIHSSLLTVGMRVRKSIAQGYKTKNTSFPSYCPTNSNIYPSPASLTINDPHGAFDSPPSSQESVPGNGASLKRGFVEFEQEECSEDGDGDGEGEVEVEVEVEQVQERSAFEVLMESKGRSIPGAKGRGKRDARRRGWHKTVARKDVRGTVVNGGKQQVEEEEDFGDASFLRPVGEVEMEVDV